jgi:translation initiation factor 1
VSRKKSSSSGQPEKPFHAPFAGLAELRGALPSVETPLVKPTSTSASPARAVVRYQRKGRGGKEATVIEQLGLSESERVSWLQQLKQALGCGGSLEGEALVLQGDQRSRIRQWLTARGVGRISVG